MSRRRYFIVGAGVLIGLQALDLISTWILTPGLENEGNAFVMWYGMGWTALILVCMAQLCFVLIPFYYHCLVFTYPGYVAEKNFTYKRIATYFLHNHKDQFVSFARALFNTLGFFLFWWFFVHKVTAVVHNSLAIIGSDYSKSPFVRQMQILDQITNISLISVMVLFFIGIIFREKNNANKEGNKRSFHFSFIILFFLLFLSFRLYIKYAKPVHSIDLTYSGLDREIILINIGEGDRAFIGNLLLAIDSCKPTVVAVDAYFLVEKDKIQDSILMNALKTTRNDVIIYGLNATGKPYKSHEKFRTFASKEGLIRFNRINGLVSRFTPIRIIDNEIHEDFSLAIVKQWKPGFEHSIKPGRSIPIKFNGLHYTVISGRDIRYVENGLLDNKIVLMGYLGPSNEDKHYTPLRIVREYSPDEPDTYGLVIVANQIRTILEYEKRN